MQSLAALSAAAVALGCGAAFAADGPISVTDQRGKTVTLSKPAERVVTFPMPAGALFASVAGGVDRLTAIHAMSKKAIEEGILKSIYPGALDLKSDITKGGTFNPNVESVLALKPDLVIQWAGRGDDLLKPMDDAGLNVIGLTYGNQERTETWIRTIAQVIGTPERADLIIDIHKTAMAEIKGKAARIPDSERRSVIYMLRAAKSLRVRGKGSYNDTYLRMVGGANPAYDAGSNVQVNPEQILAWDPDVILLGNFDPAQPEDFYTNPIFKGLKAVKNRQVYKTPLGGYRWDPPSQESPLMWKWLAKVLYPERMDFDLRADMRAFYEGVYGYKLTDAEIDGILRMDVNGKNGGYAAFASKS